MTRAPLGPDLDAARALVAARELTPAAVASLTDTVRNLPIEALGPAKQLLKRFFSDQPWTSSDEDALAEIFGSGAGETVVTLAPDLALLWGWDHDRFFLRVKRTGDSNATTPVAERDRGDLGFTFEADVFPEVTPSPRTIRFTTPALHSGPSRVYGSVSDAADDARVQRLFDEFTAVTNVLIGPDFVAVTIVHADQWDALLAPILRAVVEQFAATAHDPDAANPALEPPTAGVSAPARGDAATRREARGPQRLERAWADLGGLHADRPDDLAPIVAASHDDDPARRQVAAALLADAPPAVAADAWTALAADPSRSVRRAALDAVVDAAADGAPDAGREPLRPLLERALTDPDAWIRWKAVRGLAALGIAASRTAIDACAADPDFRVRLEAARAISA